MCGSVARRPIVGGNGSVARMEIIRSAGVFEIECDMDSSYPSVEAHTQCGACEIRRINGMHGSIDPRRAHTRTHTHIGARSGRPHICDMAHK